VEETRFLEQISGETDIQKKFRAAVIAALGLDALRKELVDIKTQATALSTRIGKIEEAVSRVEKVIGM